MYVVRGIAHAYTHARAHTHTCTHAYMQPPPTKAVLTVIENQCLKQRAPLSYSPCALVCDKLSVCMKWVRKRWELDMGTCKTSTHYTTTHNYTQHLPPTQHVNTHNHGTGGDTPETLFYFSPCTTTGPSNAGCGNGRESPPAVRLRRCVQRREIEKGNRGS